MSSFVLKIIGIITMTIDHIGILFYPDAVIFRIIGRLAYPIFAFLISEGYRKTDDLTDYMGRLLVFAFFSQLAYKMAMGRFASLNVLFTFALALYALYAYDKTKKIYIVFVVALAAHLFTTDYGAYGVLMIFIFHKYHKNIKKVFIYMTLISVLYVINKIYPIYSHLNLIVFFKSSIQMFALFSLIFIYKYNGKRGPHVKYLFYIFYPGHLLLLYYLREFLIKTKIDRFLSL
ncbi:MAG: TraX family protein [Halanaerobiaceae bacterium]